jgi:phage terminase small subunit
MATRGRKPQTDSQKKAKGETRPSRLASVNADVLEFPAVPELPTPPAWVEQKPKAVEEWERVTGLLYGQKVLTDADLMLLGHMCMLHADLLEQYETPRVQVSAADRSQLRMYAAEFGLSPSSRTRIGAGDGGKGKNPFNTNGKKKT